MSELSLPLPDALRPAKLCSDAQLARRAAGGDQRAFAEIFERHHQAVYRYCRSILRNEEDAADALQNTMAALLRGLDGETREIALKPWLFRIAHNESLSLIRRRRPDSELHEDSAVAAAGPELQALQSERLRQLVDDVQALPDRQRGALVMRELSGLEYAQIGAAFGVAEGAARQAVYEAREMLHEIGEGRAMACADVRELISARDGRLLRGRKVRAHLRTCSGCAEFRAAIGQRSAALAAVAPPLPAVMGASILQGLVGGGSGGGGVAVGGASATSVSAAAGSATTAKSLAGVGLLAQGSATAGLAAKAAAVLVVGATLTGGGVVATQQLQRDAGRSPVAGAASRPAADTGSARPATAASAAPENSVMPARRAQRQAAERAVPDGAPTAATAVEPRDDSVQRPPAASQRPTARTPTPARTANARPERPAAGPPRTSPAPGTAPAQRPASAQPPTQPSAAAPVTAPIPVAPVQAPAPGSVPLPVASAPVAPSVPQTPQPALPEVPRR